MTAMHRKAFRLCRMVALIVEGGSLKEKFCVAGGIESVHLEGLLWYLFRRSSLMYGNAPEMTPVSYLLAA
jgi:hypothetical protein